MGKRRSCSHNSKRIVGGLILTSRIAIVVVVVEDVVYMVFDLGISSVGMGICDEETVTSECESVQLL